MTQDISNITIAKPSKNISELISKNLEPFHNKNLKEKTILTGFRDFDEMCNGFKLGELIIIGGRPAMGKTQLLINFAINISKTVPVLFFTLELSDYQLTNLIISTASGISIKKILDQEFSYNQKNKIVQVENQLEANELFVNDKCTSSFSTFNSYCEKEIQENGIKVVIVDYLQLLTNNSNPIEKELEMSSISQKLKKIAEQYHICVIATSQLSRKLESRKGAKQPILTDLPEFGSILPYADKVIFLYRPEYYGFEKDGEGYNAKGVAEIILAKNKMGNTGKIKLLIDEDFTSYRDFENDFNTEALA